MTAEAAKKLFEAVRELRWDPGPSELLVPVFCGECGRSLSNEEAHYYGIRCEECEVAGSDRISAWRKGGEDAEFDRIFDAPPPVSH